MVPCWYIIYRMIFTINVEIGQIRSLLKVYLLPPFWEDRTGLARTNMKSQTCFFALTFSYLYSYALIFLLLLQIPSTVLPLPSIPLVAQTSINGSFAYQGINISHPGLCNIHGDSFSYTETINLQENSRTIQTSSCPNHYSACQYPLSV